MKDKCVVLNAKKMNFNGKSNPCSSKAIAFDFVKYNLQRVLGEGKSAFVLFYKHGKKFLGKFLNKFLKMIKKLVF